MTEAPVSPFVNPASKRPPPAARVPRSNSPLGRSHERNQPEVLTSDGLGADLLFGCCRRERGNHGWERAPLSPKGRSRFAEARCPHRDQQLNQTTLALRGILIRLHPRGEATQ
jgi:hypothetical protein